MNWFKNFLYDKGDIFIALIIFALAAIIILWRVDAIMDYPKELVSSAYEDKQDQGPITTPYDNEDKSGTSSDSGISTTTGEGIENQGEGSEEGSETPEVYAIYVNSGQNLTELGNILVSCGFYTDAEEFLTYVNAAGAASRIQMGNHFIPAGATKEECIDYLCEIGL